MRLRRERKELCYNLKASCKMEPDCDTWSWKVWERCRDWSCALPTTGSESFSSFRAAKRLLTAGPKKLILKILRQKTNTQTDPMIISFSAKRPSHLLQLNINCCLSSQMTDMSSVKIPAAKTLLESTRTTSLTARVQLFPLRNDS